MKIPVLGVAETWAPVPGYTGYEVSNQGNVRTYRPANGRGSLKKEPRPLSPRSMKGKPYLRVTLTNDCGVQKDEKVHKLVLTVFVGPRPSPDHDSCHKDGNARNNNLTNLYWGTKKDNADDRERHGTQVRGELVGKAELNTAQVLEIKAAIPSWSKGMGRKFAQRFNVSDSTVSGIKNGRTWRHL